MNSFLQDLESFIEENNLISQNDHILVGFSGGADSTALLYGLIRLKDKLHINLMAAHINYNLRGNDSLADLNFVKRFCSDYNIPLAVKEINYDNFNDLENKARKTRFDYFSTLSKKYSLNKIALAHNKGDVAETVLLHLFRGSGITGMRGILPVNGKIIRPFILFERKQIIDFLQVSGLDWQTDKTNFETIYTRNKLRIELLPYISREINPQIIDVLYNSAQIFNETEAFLKEQTNKIWQDVIINISAEIVSLDLHKLRMQYRIIVYYLIRKSLEHLCGDDYSLNHTNSDDICGLLNTTGCKEIKLANNISVKKGYDDLIIMKNNLLNSIIPVPELTVEIKNKEQKLTYNSHSFYLKILTLNQFNKQHTSPLKKDNCFNSKVLAVMDYKKITPPLTIGYRKKGDFFYPLGMAGKKKLKDYFIDKKVSKYERDNILIIRDIDKIIWVVGYRLDDRVKITNETKQVLLIQYFQ